MDGRKSRGGPSRRWPRHPPERRVAYLASRGRRLYASVYAAARPRNGVGIVICPSWGFEMASLLGFEHDLARTWAELGGAGLLYHPPGLGDSEGALQDLEHEDLVEAAVDAARTASDMLPSFRWGFVGIRLGAAVAAAAAAAPGRGSTPVLALVQPALDPADYFQELLGVAARRGHLDQDGGGWVFGAPIPATMVRSVMRPDGARAALGPPADRVAVIRCAEPDDRPASPRRGRDHQEITGVAGSLQFAADLIRIPDAWSPRLPSRTADRLRRATIGWLRAAAPGGHVTGGRT